MSGILTLNTMHSPSTFNLKKILDKLDLGDVVIMHTNYTCALIFHKCVTSKEGKQKETSTCGSKTINVFYKDVGTRDRLLGEGSWEEELYKYGASECDCLIENVLRTLWSGREKETASKGFLLLSKA